MLEIEVGLVSMYRKFFPEKQVSYHVEAITDNRATTVYDLLKIVAKDGGCEMIEMLYKEDGSIDEWSRILLNGKDIRFLSDEEKELKQGDSVYIFSVAAGG